ncbi:RNA polymerase recycling motor HelD [Paenibacillus sp. GCM10027626]|uniref:RNA polymerase recycling motor HelD n=1 Tax=Paenibacillus sp. GCM10027626 TaxID=3273411 RepID=UPI0036402E8B
MVSIAEQPEWKEEQRRVERVIAEIERRTEKLEEQTSEAREEMVEIRKNFWEDVTVNFEDAAEMAETAASMRQQAEVLFDREHTHRQAAKQLKTMRKLLQSPYFGRIDFMENAMSGEADEAAERIYLGIASLRDEEDDQYLIYDWRAPVSSLYYDYPPGAAQYETPMGVIEGELQLKRQFVIRGDEIVSMFDTGVTIGDELLQEVLGRQSDAQMKSIVATIQREQNLIIRNESSRLLIVQGAAGSGKTSAALQRVAYLLYRYRGTLTADQIVLFSPNPMFNSYVSTVLPELGEENMQQTTFQDYLRFRLGKTFRLENPYDQLEYALSAMDEPDYETRIAGIRYKASYPFVQLMERYIEAMKSKGLRFRSLSFRGQSIMTAGEIEALFYSLDHSIAIANRLRLMAEQMMERLNEFERAALNEPWVDEEIELLDKETYLKAFQTLRRKKRFSEQSFDDFEAEKAILAQYVVKERLKPLRLRIKRLSFVDMKSTYRQLFDSAEFAAAIATEQERMPAQWADICRYTLNRLLTGEIAYEDATPFLYMVERIRGFQTNTSVRHILLDEAQDYTAFQFAFIKRLFPRAKVTALGDLNQSITAHTTEESSGFAALAALYEAEETETILLRRSYRSTRPIVEFTSGLIPGGEQIIPFNRDGEPPAFSLLANRAELHDRIAGTLSALQAEGYRTIAVICKTAAESRMAHEALRDLLKQSHIRLIEQETSDFEEGLVVIPSYLSKGVEFDAVIVYDASAASYGLESERRLLYTVCTRAMHKLHLYAIEEWSPLLARR